MIDPLLILKLALIPFLIAANAFFVAAEYAVVTMRSTRIEELRRDGLLVARYLARLKQDMSGSIATIQICITATNLLLGAVAEPAVSAVIIGLVDAIGVNVPLRVVRPAALLIGLVILTFFTVVLSDLLPKALTLQYTDQIARWVARPIFIFRTLCTPLVHLMNAAGNRVTHALGLGRVQIEEPVHSEEELEMLVDRADDAGEVHEEHGDLLRRAFDFADLTIRHVMIPLRNAGVLDSNATVGELASRLSDRPYTRWPVRDPHTGRINGIVNIKMVLYAMALSAGEAVILHDLAVEPLYLDPDLPLVDALTLLRKQRQHLAVVREGDGPDLGIVTLEDILESIVGNIPSEIKPFPPRKARPPSAAG
jgi:CBS domain containing-hemolysin-like protein